VGRHAVPEQNHVDERQRGQQHATVQRHGLRLTQRKLHAQVKENAEEERMQQVVQRSFHLYTIERKRFGWL